MRQGTRLITAAIVTLSAPAAYAQMLAPIVDPPGYYSPRGVIPGPVQGPYDRTVVALPPPPSMQPPIAPGIPSYEVVGVLRSTGFLPLGAPSRRGRFYVIAAIHPNGDDGRVTIDALTGRFVRFIPADMLAQGARYEEDVYYEDQRMPPPPLSASPRAPRPPASVPKVASRATPAPTVTPKPRPATAAGVSAAQTATTAAADSPATAKPAQPAVAAVKPGFAPLPTQPLPPVQMIE